VTYEVITTTGAKEKTEALVVYKGHDEVHAVYLSPPSLRGKGFSCREKDVLHVRFVEDRRAQLVGHFLVEATEGHEAFVQKCREHRRRDCQEKKTRKKAPSGPKGLPKEVLSPVDKEMIEAVAGLSPEVLKKLLEKLGAVHLDTEAVKELLDGKDTGGTVGETEAESPVGTEQTHEECPTLAPVEGCVDARTEAQSRLRAFVRGRKGQGESGGEGVKEDA